MTNKKILLISANNYRVPYPVYPLGVSFIAGFIKEKLPGYDVTVHDLIDSDMESLLNKITHDKPGYIGVSLRNIDNINYTDKKTFIEYYQTLVDNIKKNSDAKIIIGGSGFSIFPELIFRLLDADFGIYGEGEEPVVELLNCLDNKLSLEKVPGLVYKKSGKIIKNPKLVKNTNFTQRLFIDDSMIKYYWTNSGLLNIQTKRGCPKKCIYCTYPMIEGGYVRVTDPDTAVNNIVQLYRRHKTDFFFITDSIFNIDDEYNRVFAEKLVKSGIKISWAAYFSPENLDFGTLKLLRDSGLTHIEFGTDSLSDIQLRKYNKTFTVDDVIKSSETCNKLGINFAHFLIIGGYGETDKTVCETVANAAKIKKTVFFPYLGMRIYPGTILHDISKSEGVLDKETDLLEPRFYFSDKFNIDKFKEQISSSGQQWVLPDRDFSEPIKKMRAKGKKGPLWEYLIK
jgi:radical SAM superfamily enzyme YgiQ (UPF0313 family)